MNHKIKITTVILAVVLGFTSCSVYKQYESPVRVGESSLPKWKTVFTDPCLQALIDTALVRNDDVKTTLLNIEKAEVAYKTSKLAYLPTLGFTPRGGVDKTGSSSSLWNYSIGVTAQWQLDLLNGSVTNSKRMKKASLEFQKDYEQAVRCKLVSSMAQLYYQLLGQEKNLKIAEEMEVLYEKTYESTLHLFNAGQYTSPAIHQTKAQVDNIKVQILQLKKDIITTVQAICQLMDFVPEFANNAGGKPFLYGTLDKVTLPSLLEYGVESNVLLNRPDVRMAERQMEIAFYNKKLKEGALMPKITLTGNGSWMNPTSWFIEGIGSLVQPIFQGGQLRADLKIAKLDQQIAVVGFQKIVIDASHEVDAAMKDCKLAKDKMPLLHDQTEALKQAVDATQELMNNGSATYLEVLTAMKEFLSAKLAEADNQTFAAMKLVELYGALGGK